MPAPSPLPFAPTNATASLNIVRLRGILAERQIPRTQLAKAAGLSQHYVHNILGGRLWADSAAVKILAALPQLGIDAADVSEVASDA